MPSPDERLSSPLSSLDSLSDAPSSPLSSARSSLSPPPELFYHNMYPSPPLSQQSSQTGSPAPDGMESGATTDRDAPRPAKRRRISKERTTEYLDLRSGNVDPAQQGDLELLMHVLHKRQKIVVIAGAGISVSAGIPDFRSSTGLFRSLKEEHKLKGSGKHLFDASVYKDDISTSSFHDMVSSMSRLTRHAKPTAFHHMLATIAKENRLLRLYSQNVDGIDTSLEPLSTAVPLKKDADGKWPQTVQLHGGLDKMVCSKCGELSNFDADLFSGPTPPPCSRCEEVNDIRTNLEGKRSHGIGKLRPRMVLYNEHNPDDVEIGKVSSEDLRKRPDAVIVAGTTLKVPGVRRIVREMCNVVRDRRGGVAIWINNDLPPPIKELEDCFDIVVQGPCDEVASRAAMRKWDDPVEQDIFSEISDEEARQAESRNAEVHLPPACKLFPHVPVRSSEYFNSSFQPPPDSTPRKESRASPQDWSPMSSRKSSILPSIESDGESIVVNTGLLTPTKSQKNSPAKKLPSLNDKLKDTGKTRKPVGRPPKAGKKTVKYIKSDAQLKPKKPQAKANTKMKTANKSATGPKITSNFKSSKAGLQSTVAKKSFPSPAKSPSKLRQVANASAEPMHPLSPNTSPSKRPVFPGLQTACAAQQGKKRSFDESGLVD